MLQCDLHMHTSKSDGVWPPERLFAEIRRLRLDAFSITDHDCIDAYPVPADLQPRVISGLEADSVHRKSTAHILAYGIESNDSPLLEALRPQREDRLPRMQSMVERLRRSGVAITMEDVLAQAGASARLQRPHLARALVARGAVESVGEAFERYLGDECEQYVGLERLASGTIIDLIHRSGGVAIVAHPMRLITRNALEELCALGADGVEVVNPSASPEEQRRLQAFARSRGLLVTGGSDFHTPQGGIGIGIPMEASDVRALRRAVDERRLARSGRAGPLP